MLREDFIIRLIRECAQVIAQVTRLTKQQQYRAALDLADEALKDLMGFDLDHLPRLSENELVAHLYAETPTHLLRQKREILIEVLTASGELYALQQKRERADDASLKALNLLLDAWVRSDVDRSSGNGWDIEAIRDRISAPLPARTHYGLMQYFEAAGQFGKAEDALYDLHDQEPDNPKIERLGFDFYERLLGYDAECLKEGNLPREEVLAGREDWRRLSEAA